MRRLRRPQAHTLAGAYALDAVTGADRARFERHLARCQDCAGELRELREAAARLAAAVAADPPAELVERVVAAASRTRQWPPDTGREERSWRPVRHARRGGGLRRSGGLRRGGPLRGGGRLRRGSRLRGGGGLREGDGQHGATGPGGPRPGVSRRAALGVAAVFLAAAAASGAVAASAEHHLGADRARAHAIAEVLNAPDAVMVTARVTGGGTATVVTSRRDRALVFTAAGLPTLPAGSCYQLWLMGPTGDRPALVLPAPDHGMTGPVIATGVNAGDWVGLTVSRVGHMTGALAAHPILMLNLA